MSLDMHEDPQRRELGDQTEENKPIQEALRRRQFELKAIYENAPIMMCVLDPSRQVIYANQAFLQFIGEPEEKVLYQRACGVIGCLRANDDPRGCGHGPLCQECKVRLAFADASANGKCHRGIEYRTSILRQGQAQEYVFLTSIAPIPMTGQTNLLLCLEDITERKRFEEVQSFLAQTKSGPTDEPFFHALARYLAKSLHMDYVCIDHLEGEGLTARTVAVWHNGVFEDNVTYGLHDTPCGELAGKMVCCFPQAVRELFPRDKVLQDLKAESYVGVTLWSHAGEPIGLIAVIGRHPLINQSQAETTLKLVAVRAAGEMERMNAESALRQSEAFRREVLDSLSAHIAVLDQQGTIVAVNEAWVRFAGENGGKGARVLPGDNYLAACESATEPHTRAPAREALLGIQTVMSGKSTSFSMEYDCHSTTEQRWFCMNVRRLSGAKEGVVIAHEDITERRLATEQLRANTERFRRISAMTSDIAYSCLTDQDDRYFIDWMTGAVDRITGYTVEEVTARRCWKFLVVEEDQALFLEKVAGLIPGTQGICELRLRHRNGEIVWVASFAECVTPTDGGGKSVLYGCLAAITERKKAEAEKDRLQAQLYQSQKMESVGRLAGGVAHDFNNMLQAILGNVGLAMQSAAPGSSLRESLEEISACAKRSADLTRQLLAFARRQTVIPKLLDLNETVEGLLKMMRRLIGEHIRLAWQPAAGLWWVKMDPSQVDQILANLCVNARDAIGKSGLVSIETGNVSIDEADCSENLSLVPGEYVLLSVTDNGCGMDKETLAHLFEPFFTTKDVGVGTGMGLATVYGIVKQNHGFVQVESRLGRGTSFLIYLPRHVNQGLDHEPPEPLEKTGLGHETVLFVEDEPTILKIGRQILQELGYQVIAAATPGQALQLAREHSGKIHLLITDVIMPEMNGKDLAARLISLQPGIRQLFMSGYTADVIANHGVLDESVQFIQKPFTVEDLSAKVRIVLNGARPT